MERQPAESSIVIVTYNSMTTLERCISSVLDASDGGSDVVVVDNGSRDGTAAFLEELAGGTPGVNVVCNRDNLGYSAAANIGIRRARREYIVLLNPDTVVRPGWLNEMREVFRLPKVGAVGPVSNCTAGLQYIEFHIPKQGTDRLSYDQLHELVRDRNRRQSVETELIMGFCVMLSRTAIEEVGLLDEDLFLGCDDLEQEVRDQAVEHGTVWVITGTILSMDVDLSFEVVTIGAHDVLVPTHLFKIVVREDDDGFRAMTFVIPNVDVGHRDFDQYAVSVDDVEELTFFNFCNSFSAAVQAEFEDDIVTSEEF